MDNRLKPRNLEGFMKKNADSKEFKMPDEVPKELFDIVSQVLSFLERVDEIKSKRD
ncbi:hypothetical protein SAMN02745945_02372 [Peptoclostridium litorale DSM 5388]|uniref:Uncharacterized protein n=1 Tax=Peptoclostridium litorale DSM 5388 TaxID=1121324 RepID=A0A069RC49_PEPLI|nr:hypothetical protein [Peptoclostridium litorale]KDR94363.1 hypothetical protein CLIT_20c00080 [Peptoclostridium litorale DSM 5388]SIO25132.1 hypothetical protein SAMN02745945_02372 [Peptoclostridium litorale DSM 5388]